MQNKKLKEFEKIYMKLEMTGLPHLKNRYLGGGVNSMCDLFRRHLTPFVASGAAVQHLFKFLCY